MIEINCKKCNTNVVVKDKRFKYCNNCSSKKKNKIIFNNCSDMLYNEIIIQICNFLTTTDIILLSYINKYYNNCIKNNVILWKYISVRDFNFTIIKNIKNNCYAIDSGILCYFCGILICKENCIFYNKQFITKTDAKTIYKISNQKLNDLIYIEKYNNTYRKFMSLYQIKDIFKQVAVDNKGLSNFFLKKNLKDLQTRNKKNNYIQWKNTYENKNKLINIEYNTIAKRRYLLNIELGFFGLIIRPDSMLCNTVITHGFSEYCLEHVVSILRITDSLFQKGKWYYLKYHELYKNKLITYMYKNKNITWYNITDNLIGEINKL